MRLCPSRTVDVDGSGKRGNPANSGPRLHLSLGYKYALGHSAENQDVEITQVIGNNQTALREFSFNGNAHADAR
jgi:hypothetical protein